MSRALAKPELPAATLSEYDGVRFLHLGGTIWVQGAMRLKKPNAIELEYVQRMMAWMLLRAPKDLARGQAMQFGLGAAAITRFCHRVLRMRTIAVELNPGVIRACRAWFRLADDDDRLSVVQADAARYAAEARHAGTADVLCVDLYDHEAAAPVLDTEEFYRDCHRVLADGGVMTVNLFGRAASFERSCRHIVNSFGADQVAVLEATREGNTIVMAWRGFAMPDHETLALRAANIETRFGLPASKWPRLLKAPRRPRR